MSRLSNPPRPGHPHDRHPSTSDHPTLPQTMTLPNDALAEIDILHVEDDDIDAMAFERHMGHANFKCRIHRAIDGVSALEMLRGDGVSTPPPVPHIILLDLNMPRMTGIEFLQELRADERLRRCVVFVFTTSNALKDRGPCFEHNVAAYLLKSNAGSRFENLIALLESYVNLAEFPPEKCIDKVV